MSKLRPSTSKAACVAAGVLGLCALLAPPCSAQLTATNFQRTTLGGFGDRQNNYSWSMRWFKGKLYVGTNRNFQCVENATLAFYFPILIPLQAIFVDPDVPCPPDPTDLDLRAEVWRYTPESKVWDRVYQSPVVPNPLAPTKSIALDIGYRDMVVYNEPDGTEALYLVSASAREYTPGLPPPRILRTTDGVNFAPIPQDPGTALGELPAVTFRATAVYNGKFYVTASPGLTGDGFLLESEAPWLGNNAFRLVTPPAFKVYEMAVFNGSLYIGGGDTETGYSVWKTNATGNVPYNLTPIVTGGAGRGKVQTSVVSMFVFRGSLFVGSAGWFTTLLPSSELIRVNANDTWDLISGNPRSTPRGLVYPLSGLSDGFGSPFNAHIWRMQEHNGWLYAGTNDDSWGFRHTPLDPYLRPQYGFDLFASPDGVLWLPVSRNGFGNPFTFGVRTFASTPAGLFLGTVNYAHGTDVYLGNPAPVNGFARSATPSRLDLEPTNGAEDAVLSWGPTKEADHYRVFRSTGRAANLGPLLGAQGGAGPRSNPPLTTLPGGFVDVGTTTKPVFHDEGLKSGGSYTYYVVAEDAQGEALSTSSLAALPSQAPTAGYNLLGATVAEAARRDGVESKALADLVKRSKKSANDGDLKAAREQLDELEGELLNAARDGLSDQAVEDLRRLISKLKRRIGLVESGEVAPKGVTR